MKKTYNQKGNVLFLILIAVALFAALSYAVTQSSRTGGDASRETNILNAAQLTQYPVSIRTAVLRMIIDGYQDTQIAFSKTNVGASVSDPLLVFNSIGGGAIYQDAPGEVMADGNDGTWFFNMNFEIPGLGRESATSSVGNDLIAFLPGVQADVCTRINREAGILSDPRQTNPIAPADYSGGTTTDYDMDIDDPAADIPNSETNIVTSALAATPSIAGYGANILDGEPFGCFRNNTNGDYVFYSVLLER